MRLLLALMLLLVGCSAAPPAPASRTTPSASPRSSGPVWSERPVHFVGIGDSVTKGFGASDGGSYFQQLQGRLEAVFPHMQATNLSVSTTTSSHHLDIQLPQLSPHGKDVFGWVVITTGGNDLIHNYGRTSPQEEAMFGASPEQARPWTAHFKKRLNTLLDGLRLRFPGGVRVFLANIYDPTDGQGDIQNAGLPLPPWPGGLDVLDGYNAVIEEAAARRPEVELVDVHKAFMGHGIHHGDEPYYYYSNLEDPNDAGYDRLTELFFDAMQSSVRERPL